MGESQRSERDIDGVVAGLKAQLERSSHFLDTVDIGAATTAYYRVLQLFAQQLGELRLAAGLRSAPRPFTYWYARFGPQRYVAAPVPQQVYTFWNRPIDTAPPLVQVCVAQMRRVYPQVQVLDGTSVRELIEIPERIATLLEVDRPAHFSDYLRTRILAEHGGIWLDATAWINRDLTTDLRHYLRAGTVFPRWTQSNIGNWFIASHAGTPVITLQWHGLQAWWEAHDDLPDYFLYHRIFEVLNWFVPEMRGQWGATPTLSSTQAHLLQLQMMQPYDASELREMLAGAPLQKLSYKYDTVPPGSVLAHLLDTGSL